MRHRRPAAPAAPRTFHAITVKGVLPEPHTMNLPGACSRLHNANGKRGTATAAVNSRGRGCHATYHI